MPKKRGNGTGSVYFLGKGRKYPWGIRITINYDENGKQKYKCIGTAETKRKAEKLLELYNSNPNLYLKLKEFYKKYHLTNLYDFMTTCYVNEEYKYNFISSVIANEERQKNARKEIENLSSLNTIELSNLTVWQVMKSFLNTKEKQVVPNEIAKTRNLKKKVEITENTYSIYSSAFTKFEKYYDLKFKELRMPQFDEIKKEYQDSPGVLAKIKTFYNQVYDYAKLYDVPVGEKYSASIVVVSQSLSEPVPFNEIQIQTMFDNVNNMELSEELRLGIKFVLIMIYAPLRVEAYCDILGEKCNQEEEYYIGGNKTDNGKNCLVPWHERVKPFIIELLKDNPKYLFHDKKNKHFSKSYFINNYFKKVMIHFDFKHQKTKRNKKTGKMETVMVYHTPHETKHTFATRCNNARANQIVVEKMLGHRASGISADRYTHAQIEERKEVIRLLP